MSIEVSCGECGALLRVNSRLAGRRVRCSRCDAAVTIPAATVDPESGPEPRANGAGNPPAEGGGQLYTAEEDRSPIEAAKLAEALRSIVNGNDSTNGEGAETPIEPETGARRIEFGSDPIFDSHGHHAATDLPSLPPALLGEEGDDDPPPRNKRKEDELDMTPMVDVTFLLLIFFMVTASFSLQKSIEMPRQQSDAPSTNVQEDDEEETDMVTVQIDEYGSFLVLAIDWERETPGKQNLIRALRDAIGEISGAVRLVIEVHEDAKLKYLVDCMDAGTICGYAEAQITQVDGFD